MHFTGRGIAGVGLALALTAGAPAGAPTKAGGTPGPAPLGDGTFLLTIFLKHDQSRPLGKINEQLKAQGFFQAFPPPGVEVVSWYVMMGIGQVVTPARAGGTAAGGEPCRREHRLGWLPHGVLPDLRLQGHRRADAGPGGDQVGEPSWQIATAQGGGHGKKDRVLCRRDLEQPLRG